MRNAKAIPKITNSIFVSPSFTYVCNVAIPPAEQDWDYFRTKLTVWTFKAAFPLLYSSIVTQI